MCGIAGLMDPGHLSETQIRATVTQMTGALHHRGPDADGIWIGEGIGLGHRRLAIVDLSSTGAQPMSSDCGRYVLVFNGEIYNHQELRQTLTKAGAVTTWRGHSDTETLLAGIAKWGLDATLTRAVGMFSLALWDRQKRQLSLARDRIGEKPLYWGRAGSALIFGSELKALRACSGFPSGICPGALAQYLRYSYIPAPRSIHPGIFKLEPGCILEIGSGAVLPEPDAEPLRPGEGRQGLSIRRWWSLTDMIGQGRKTVFNSESEALEALESSLTGAVARQMVADVPLGAFLSGGIDSSLIVALMQAQSAKPVQTFTIGFEDAAFNEAPYAAAVARHLGTDHSELTVTEADAQEVIPLLPELYDEPFADSSQIPTFLVCQAARRHVSVALSGDAGDELFGGYNRYIMGPALWKKLSRYPMPLRRALARMVLSLSPETWDRLGRVYNALRPSGNRLARPGDKLHRVAQRLHSVRSVDDLHRSMTSIWTDPVVLMMPDALLAEPPSQLDDPLPVGLSADPAARMMAQDMRSYLPDDILCKVDRAAMGTSLETRVPFLDPDVMSVAARLPAQMRIRDGQGKWALRQILYRYVPRDLIERPKTGFGIPVGDWLRGPLRGWAEDLLAEHSLSCDGLLAPAPIRLAWEEHLSGRRDWTNQLWIILMLQAWRQRQT